MEYEYLTLKKETIVRSTTDFLTRNKRELEDQVEPTTETYNNTMNVTDLVEPDLGEKPPLIVKDDPDFVGFL